MENRGVIHVKKDLQLAVIKDVYHCHSLLAENERGIRQSTANLRKYFTLKLLYDSFVNLQDVLDYVSVCLMNSNVLKARIDESAPR